MLCNHRLKATAWSAVLALALLASSASSRAAVDLKGDTRLAVNVTLSMGNATLESVLKALSEKTGVPMAAGQKQEEWQVREMPVNVFVKDVPAWEVMEHLAKLTDFIWSAVGEGESKGYRIWQDLKARQRQAEEKENRLKSLQADRVARGMKSFEDWAKLSHLSAKELEELSREDPVAFFIATQPGFKAVPTILASLNQEQRLRATTREGIRIPYSDMSPQLQQAVRDMVFQMRGILERVEPRGPGQSTSQEPDWEKTALVMKSPLDEWLESNLAPVSEIMITSQDEPVPITMSFPVFDTRSPFGKFIGKVFRQMAEGTPLTNLEVTMRQEFADVMAKGLEPPQEPPTDPELLKTVKWEAKGWSSLDKELGAFHEASGLNLVADGLPQPGMGVLAGTVVVGHEAKVYEILNLFKNLCGLQWEKEGPVVRMRDRDWAKKRDWLIPREKLSRWRAKASADEGLRIADLAEMATLTEDQVRYGLMADRQLSPASAVLGNKTRRHLLAFIGSLSPEQISRLEAGDSLTAASLTAEQTDHLQQMWMEMNNAGRPGVGPLPSDTTITVEDIAPAPGQGDNKKPGIPLLKRDMVVFMLQSPSLGALTGRATHFVDLYVPRILPLPETNRPNKEQKAQTQAPKK